jgi:hypothetical protein
MKTKYIVQSIAGILAIVALVYFGRKDSESEKAPSPRSDWPYDWRPESVVCSDDGKTVYIIISNPRLSESVYTTKVLLVSHDSGKTWTRAF